MLFYLLFTHYYLLIYYYFFLRGSLFFLWGYIIFVFVSFVIIGQAKSSNNPNIVKNVRNFVSEATNNTIHKIKNSKIILEIELYTNENFHKVFMPKQTNNFIANT